MYYILSIICIQQIKHLWITNMKNEIRLKEIFKNHLKEKNIVLEKENFDEAF